MMAELRIPLYDRLPEIYRIRDQEQQPPGQLAAYLAPVEQAFSSIHANIEQLYDDLFIETCADWVIPYIADLLGTSHLSGDPWTLRADVADTIALRRRKGTLGAIELLAFDLTRWAAHAVELREILAWQQHLNHQRPDAGGTPPYGTDGPFAENLHHTVIRGGTATLRDPATLSLLGTPFDNFARLPDFKPPVSSGTMAGGLRPNIPNLAIFLWRLAAYRVGVVDPPFRGEGANAAASGDEAPVIARFDCHPRIRDNRPLGEPVQLFNTYRFQADEEPPELSELDRTPGPIPRARLTSEAPAGNPEAYVAVTEYNPDGGPPPNFEQADVGLQLFVPQDGFGGDVWRFRGANLCAWEEGLSPPLNNREIAIDPRIGRIAIGVASSAEATALRSELRLSYTYGAVGPVGAHPVSRDPGPESFLEEPVIERRVNAHVPGLTLRAALADLQDLQRPLVVTIEDSMTHDLNLSTVAGSSNADGDPALLLGRSLIIRALSGERPMIRLRRPLRFRPAQVIAGAGEDQDDIDAVMDRLTVRLEGLYVTRRSTGFPAGEPLIARAAINRLEIIGCTLDPGGAQQLDGDRAVHRSAMRLRDPFEFAVPAEEEVFDQSPQVLLQRSISGSLLMAETYSLELVDSIVDAGGGVADEPGPDFAIAAADDQADEWGPKTVVRGVTLFGRTRVFNITGRGAIFVQRLQALDSQHGCLKFSYIAGKTNRIPQHHACVFGPPAEPAAHLRFTSETFGQPGYAQLAMSSDAAILESGPDNDQMGAFGFLSEAHKWRNLQIRFREFMPVGVRPLLIPVT